MKKNGNNDIFLNNLSNDLGKLFKRNDLKEIDEEITKLLKSLLNKTFDLVEEDILAEEVKAFDSINEKVQLSYNKIKYDPSLKVKLLDILPGFEKSKNKTIIQELKEDFDLDEIKKDLIDLFLIVELTLDKLELFLSKYSKHKEVVLQVLNHLQEYKSKILDMKEKNTKNIDLLDNIYINLEQVNGYLLQLEIILSLYIKRIKGLHNKLKSGKDKFHKVFNELIVLRSVSIAQNVKNEYIILKNNNLNENLKNVVDLFGNIEKDKVELLDTAKKYNKQIKIKS